MLHVYWLVAGAGRIAWHKQQTETEATHTYISHTYKEYIYTHHPTTAAPKRRPDEQVRDCVYITDHAYTREEVLEMEQTILRRLKFELTVPTPWTFLVRFLKVAKATDRQHHRAQYYLERCLQEHDGLSFRPSMLAAASVFLARIPEAGLEDAWVSLRRGTTRGVG